VAIPKHRRFFESPASAEDAGFRPCLRWRPELAPGQALIDAVNRGLVMTKEQRSTSGGSGSGSAIDQVAARFIEAFQRKDASAIPDLVAEDCVMETMQPAPDGERVEGYDANVRFWQAMVSDPNGSFEVEDLVVCGDRIINRWRYRFGEGDENSIRGVTLIQVRGGKIVEALAYAKTAPRTSLGQVR
jgi:ketosteroid isomerase-like protein